MATKIYIHNKSLKVESDSLNSIYNPFITQMEVNDGYLRIYTTSNRTQDLIVNISELRDQDNNIIGSGSEDDVVDYLSNLGFDLATSQSVDEVANSLQAHIDSHVNYYIDEVQKTNIDVRYYNLTISGGSGQCSKYLTSDGLAKSVGNTFLFTSVLYGHGISNTIESIAEAATCFGFSYNTTTGLGTWLFLESKNTGVLIGGNVEGLEAQENSSTVVCGVIGIR